MLYQPLKAPISDFADVIDQYWLVSGQLFIVGDYIIYLDCNENAATKGLLVFCTPQIWSNIC